MLCADFEQLPLNPVVARLDLLHPTASRHCRAAVATSQLLPDSILSAITIKRVSNLSANSSNSSVCCLVQSGSAASSQVQRCPGVALFSTLTFHVLVILSVCVLVNLHQFVVLTKVVLCAAIYHQLPTAVGEGPHPLYRASLPSGASSLYPCAPGCQTPSIACHTPSACAASGGWMDGADLMGCGTLLLGGSSEGGTTPAPRSMASRQGAVTYQGTTFPSFPAVRRSLYAPLLAAVGTTHGIAPVSAKTSRDTPSATIFSEALSVGGPVDLAS